MKRTLLALVVAVLLAGAGVGAGVFAQSSPALSEVQTLKATLFKAKVEIAQLRAALADREAKIASFSLSQEQVALETEFLAVGPKGTTWDWEKMTFTTPLEPTKK